MACKLVILKSFEKYSTNDDGRPFLVILASNVLTYSKFLDRLALKQCSQMIFLENPEYSAKKSRKSREKKSKIAEKSRSF